jgi:hypothetical protein
VPKLHRTLALWLLVCALAEVAAGQSLTGICPDGSIFIVQSEAQIPCARARRVDASELPPIRPEYLPRPYGWIVDQEARDPNNPYNMVEAAEKIRALHAAGAARPPAPATPVPPAVGAPPPTAAPSGAAPPPLVESAGAPRVSLAEEDVADLARLVVLRQQVAPAELRVDDISGREELRIQLAYSESFEALVLESLGHAPGDGVVLAFLARLGAALEFHPNFFVVQGPLTFRPDPERSAEVGFVLGDAGPQPAGAVLLGYVVVPPRFDPAQPLDLWWNDRSVEARLR